MISSHCGREPPSPPASAGTRILKTSGAPELVREFRSELATLFELERPGPGFGRQVGQRGPRSLMEGELAGMPVPSFLCESSRPHRD